VNKYGKKSEERKDIHTEDINTEKKIVSRHAKTATQQFQKCGRIPI